MKYLYTLPGCVLGYHYKVFQWLNLVQITKGPLLHHVVLRRVHTFTHSFPTRRICRESTLSAPLIGMPNYPLPHTIPGRTHVGSWLHYFHTTAFQRPPDKAPNYWSPPNTVPNLSPQIPILYTNREIRY
jgi:hypothetical protein